MDWRGATALSYGAVNINRNTDATKLYSGVANSLIGQANVTTNSNAAIILGAGNKVENSYRDIDAATLFKDGQMDEKMRAAVPNSGGQVMVMGGGNSVDKAYMTQVTGVGNTVSGRDSIYVEGTSTQYNFVDGFQNGLTNGKHDYIIGSKNKVNGDSVDKNQSNIIFGDNHKLTNQKNNVIIGSSDTADDETTVSDIVAIGHNAKVSAEGGVAIGSGSEATVEGNKVAGYDPATGAASTNTASAAWQATNGAVSIGTADGNVTRQINGVAAGTKETDAVNVAQLKTAQTSLTDKGLKFKGDDGNEVARKLSDTLTLKGGVTNTGDLSTAANIGVVKDGDGGLKIELAKNLTGLTSVTTGNTTIDNSGLTIKNATDATKNIVINSNNVSLGGNTITNMGSGLGNTYTGDGDNNSATIGDVKNLADARKTTVKSSDGTVTVTDKNTTNADSHDYDLSVNYGKAADSLTLNYTGDNNTKGSNKLSDSVAFNGTTGQIETKAENGKVTFKLADDMKTKTIMVTGENGNDGQIGLKGKDGKDGTVTTIIKTIGKNGTDGKPGVDGQNGITRIVYQDGKDGESGTTTHTVATLDDGLKFKGDDNQEVTRKLNDTLTLKGGVTNTSDLSTAANIGVVKDGDGVLKIELAKKLTGLTSVTTGNTTIDNSGLTIKNDGDTTKNIVINSSKVSLGGNKITNVGDGAISSGSKDAINGGTLYNEVRPTAGKYVRFDNTTAQNLTSLDSQIQSHEAQLTNMDNRSVKYDMSTDGKSVDKTKITLAGEDGTTIANVKDGSVANGSNEAVNGGQLFTEQEARKAADEAINNKIGTLDTTKTYNYIDATKSISDNLDNLDTKVKKDITDINNSISTLDQNTVKYDDSTKSQITLDGGV